MGGTGRLLSFLFCEDLFIFIKKVNQIFGEEVQREVFHLLFYPSSGIDPLTYT